MSSSIALEKMNEIVSAAMVRISMVLGTTRAAVQALKDGPKAIVASPHTDELVAVDRERLVAVIATLGLSTEPVDVEEPVRLIGAAAELLDIAERCWTGHGASVSPERYHTARATLADAIQAMQWDRRFVGDQLDGPADAMKSALDTLDAIEVEGRGLIRSFARCRDAASERPEIAAIYRDAGASIRQIHELAANVLAKLRGGSDKSSGLNPGR